MKKKGKRAKESTTEPSRKHLRDIVLQSTGLDHSLRMMPGEKFTDARKALVFETMLDLVAREAASLHQEAENGDPMAVNYLLLLATVCCRELQNLSLQNPELVTEFAQKAPLWPVLTGNQTLVRESTETLLERINLGKDFSSPLNIDRLYDRHTPAREIISIVVTMIEEIRKRANAFESIKKELELPTDDPVNILYTLAGLSPEMFSGENADTPITSMVIDDTLHERLCQVLRVDTPFRTSRVVHDLIQGASSLPDLTKEPATIKSWTAVIRRFLMSVYDGHPEKTHLRFMGLSRATKSATAEKGSDTSEANIRDGIFASLNQTLKNMAADIQK